MLYAPSAVHDSGEPLVRDGQGPHPVGSTGRVGADCFRNVREQIFLVRNVVVNGGIVVEVEDELPSWEEMSNGVKVGGESAFE